MRIKSIFFSFILVVIHSCSSSSVSSSPAELYNREWVLFGSSTTGITAPIRTISFQTNGKISGVGVCNSFGGLFTTNRDRINFTITEMTEVFCGDGQTLEGAYFELLEKAYSFSIEADSLTLLNSQNETIAIFKTGLIY